MLRCSQCGRVNREGSLFCQECGKRLTESSPKPAAGPVCASCGTVNTPGMNFCKMCGSGLSATDPPAPSLPPAAVAPSPAAAAFGSASTIAAGAAALGVAATMAPGPAIAAAAAAAATPSAKLVCQNCGKPTPVGFQFCQHCGQRVTTAAAAPAPVAPAPSPSPVPSPRPLTPPAGVAKISPAPAVSAARVPVVSPDALAQTVAPSTARMEPLRREEAQQLPSHGRLIQVNRDGSDGDVVQMRGELFDVGRSEGALRFEEDLFLAPRHIRFLLAPGRVVLQPLDRVNGVYIRVKGGIDLESGDQLLLGKELVRFELMAIEEQSQAPIFDQGVRLLGSVVRNGWGRLRQLTGSGTSGDLWHLIRDEYVLGREEGDLVFPDDEFMSRRHAVLKRIGVKTRCEDLGSSNGTYLRVRRERTLQSGDILRMGDQLMRFES